MKRQSIIVVCLLISTIFSSFFLIIEESNNVKGYTFAKTIIVAQDGTGDYTSVYDAVNVSSNGDIIRIYDGNYGYDGSFYNDITIIGNGSGKTILRHSRSTNLNSYSESLFIHDLTMISASAGLQFSGEEKHEFINCTFNTRTGISPGGSEIIIENCTFNTEQRIVLSISHIVKKCVLKNNIFSSVSSNDGIKFYTANIRMKGNQLINTKIYFDRHMNDFSNFSADESNTMDGIPMFSRHQENNIVVPDRSSLVVISKCNNVFINNHSLDSPNKVFHIFDSSNVYIENSTFTDSYQHCIKGDQITGLYINNTKFTNQTYGIYFEKVDQIFITNSIFTNVYIFDITGSHFTFSNNIFEGDGNDKGLLLRGPSYEYDILHDVKILSNEFRSLEAGIYIRHRKDIDISRNIFTNCPIGGALSALENLTFTKNEFIECDTGLSLTAIENLTFTENEFIECNTGLKIVNNPLLSPLETLNNSEFHSCDIGIYGYGYFHFDGMLFNNHRFSPRV